ncbi:MAG: sigma 54-interacting transcriptional regulator [Eubacteriaceae bacterium]
MNEQMIAIIKNENKFKPLTDEQIAEKLLVRREYITLKRKELGIEDSRERLKNSIIEFMQNDLNHYLHLSDRGLTKVLNEIGFEISRNSVGEIKKHLQKTMGQEKNEEKPLMNNESSDAFSNLVGHDRSLAAIIKQAKAAMMYPPRGLHTLILGETGVGKSDLATAMFNFSKELNILDKTANFIVFNCADYAENPELLMSQIFGYKKGAFTGADRDKEGLVEKANNSILFLDEIHRLPPEGQEQLFYLIDKGKFRRLGETNHERNASLTIIAATTENPELTLLGTFRRRIPMVIEIPSLTDRPLREKFDIIRKFIYQEAVRVNRPIQLESDAIRALLLFDCPGNLGQLKSEIQVACARSFLNMVVAENKTLVISTEELSNPAKRGLLQVKYYREDLEKILGDSEIIISPGNAKLMIDDDSLRGLSNEIYGFIEDRYNELQKKYESQEIINYIIGNEIDKKLISFVKKVEGSKKRLTKEELINIFGLEILNVVEKVVQVTSKKFNINLENLYYILAAHLSATIERIKSGKVMKNPQLERIKREHGYEFQVALEIIKTVEKALEIKLPEDEAGFITMYIRMTLEGINEEEEGYVGVIIASHGCVASGMASVANKLLGVNHAKFIEMALDEKPQNALERTIELVKKTDLGKGVLLLVDMGSLVSFGNIITERTGIKTRTIVRTDTVLVIDAVRRAILPESNLDEIADGLLSVSKGQIKPFKNAEDSEINQKIILTICITGHGGALKIKDILESVLGEEMGGFKILPMGLFDKKLEETIRNLERKNQVIGIVGSIDPKIKEIPFVNLSELSKRGGIHKIRELLGTKKRFEPILEEVTRDMKLLDLIDEDNIFFEESIKSKEDGILFLGKKLIHKGLVQKEFINTVLEREELSSTYFRDGIAIPHGMPELVLKPTMGILKLEKPINWDGKKVSLVVLMAVNSDCLAAIGEFYDFFDGTDNSMAIKNTKTAMEIKNIFLKL